MDKRQIRVLLNSAELLSRVPRESGPGNGRELIEMLAF